MMLVLCVQEAGTAGKHVLIMCTSHVHVYAIVCRIRVFGCKKGKPLAALNFHSESVQSVAFATSDSPEKYNNLLICGSKDHRISLWKLY